MDTLSAATVGEVRWSQPDEPRSSFAATVPTSGRELDVGSSGQVCGCLAVLADTAERLIRDMSSSTENREHITNLTSVLENLLRFADDNDDTLGRSIVRLQHLHSAAQATSQWLALGW